MYKNVSGKIGLLSDLYDEVFVVGKIKPIPIRAGFYKQMIDEGDYYVDKTLLIHDLLEQKNTVTLFIRPKRFGNL